MSFKRTARYLTGLGACILLLAPHSIAAPTIDGQLDAGQYTQVASSPKDNLLTYTDASANPVNDNTDPRTRVADVTDLYATNDGSALYVWAGLPYYDFANAQGSWSLVLHLGGANDSVSIVQPYTDPYVSGGDGNPGTIFFNYSPSPNAVLKANFKSPLSGDGTNGFSDLVTVATGGTGWDYGDTAGTRNYFGMDGVPVTAAATMVHSNGHNGAEMAYQKGDGTLGGVEIKIPLADFNHNGLTPPKVGDVLRMQFITTVYASGGAKQRTSVDNVPFEPGSRYADGTAPPNVPDLTFGFTTLYANYTLKAAAALEVDNAAFVDLTHLAVRFTDTLGAGANVAANYTVVDVTNGNTPVAVSAAAIDGTAQNQANLTTASLTYGHTYKITVANVKSAGGATLSTTKNSAQAVLPVQVTFELTDGGGVILPTDVVTVTGSFRGWVTGEGNEPVLTPVNGKPNTYSVTVTSAAGPIEYKYRLNYTDWDKLNRRNHKADITAPGPVTLHDAIGGSVATTFHLTIYQPSPLPAGRDVYVTGDWNGFSTDTAAANAPIKLNPVSGQPGVYEGTGAVTQNVWEYKYILIDPAGVEAVDYDALNASNRTVTIVGAGTPLKQTVTDIAGVAPVTATAADALRVAGGLDPAPATGDPKFAALNVVDTGTSQGTIDLLDALKLARP
jgi:hypothetical protein